MKLGQVKLRVTGLVAKLGSRYDQDEKVEILARVAEAVLTDEAMGELRQRIAAPVEDPPSKPASPVEAAPVKEAAPVSVPDETTQPEPSREDRIREAIGQLEAGNEDHFTKGGNPVIGALKTMTGISDITGAERDAAWEAFNA